MEMEKLDDFEVRTEQLETAEQNKGETEISVAGREVEPAVSAYMRRISDCRPLPLEEEQRLGRIIRGCVSEGEHKKARDKLIEANLKFVVKVAHRYRNSGLAMSDLINQGNLGLVEAARRYDPTKGVKFITYAVWWIRQYIFQGIAEQTGVVRLPLKQAQTAYKTGKADNRLRQKLHREPTDAEVAEELGLKEKDLFEVISAVKQSVSLETPINEGEDITFASNLRSLETSTEETVIRNNFEQIVGQLVGELDSREMDIISLRYGLNDGEERTLEELGKKFGVSRERIRQIETRALDKLRKRASKLKMQTYLAS
jgi:RNA polymerase primary sigma factor